jgi:hypothetical protein
LDVGWWRIGQLVVRPIIMSVYFIHISSPKHPENVKAYLDELNAEPFEDGFIIKTDSNMFTVFGRMWQWVRKQGFLYMVDSARPEKELSYPPEARSRYLRSMDRLDTLARRFQERFPKNPEYLPD